MRRRSAEPASDGQICARATHMIASVALHSALVCALYFATLHREPGIGADSVIVELTLIPGLEQVLEDALPSGSESAEAVVPEPDPAGQDAAPEQAVEVVETAVPAVAESPPPSPPPAPSSELADADSAPPAPPETDPVERTDTSVAEATPESPTPATDLDVTELAALVVSTPRRELPSAPRTLTPMSSSELKVLEQRVSTWAQGFAELAEWQPTTNWIEDDREYSATVTRVPAHDNMGVESAVVTVTTQRDGQTFTTEMRMQRLGFAHFAQFIDRWDPEVQIHDDEIDGRFHSNSEIKISRSGGVQPVFHGKVTTARGVDTSSSERRVRRNEVFLGGLETRVGRITLPRRVVIFGDDDAVPGERVHRLDESARIEFLADGSYAWSPLASAAAPQRRSLGFEPFYLIADEGAEIHVHGVVNGKVLVYSPADIVVDGNIVYAADPLLDPDSDDYLGLVSDGTVEVAEPEITGPGDLTIQAAVYARLRFAVRAYRSRRSGTLYVHGSITAGSVTATEPRFRTSLSFDDRLEKARPPSFPVTDRFEIADWSPSWSVEREPAAALGEP